MDPVIAILLLVIALVLYGILTAVKSGFNQVIQGLEALEQASSKQGPG